MKFSRISYPGKTLAVATLDRRFELFTAYFLRFWLQRFGTKPDVVIAADADGRLTEQYASPVKIPENFFKLWLFFLRHRYTTILFLNPDHRKDVAVKWAARLAFVRNRAGFAPLKNFLPLNFSLPFNGENHHFVHQLKLFFEHLTGEKLAQWAKPEINVVIDPEAAAVPVVALDATDESLPHVLQQLIRFINLIARDNACTVLIRSGGSASAAELARTLSAAMTERAIENTTPVIDPPYEIICTTLAKAAWVAGADLEVLNLAAALEVPTLAVFGPFNERVWQPFAPRARVLTGEFACRPCTPYPGAVVCKNAIPWECLSGMSAELMLATIQAMLRRKVKPA